MSEFATDQNMRKVVRRSYSGTADSAGTLSSHYDNLYGRLGDYAMIRRKIAVTRRFSNL